MKGIFEHLPDEILLIICQYLSQYHIIWAFSNLNNRLNCTISQFCQSLFISDSNSHSFTDTDMLQLLPIIGPYLRSLTIKSINLSSSQISLASNIQELTFIQTQPHSIPPLPHLTDLNIIMGLSFQSIDILFLNNNDNIHSIYIVSSSPLTVPIISPPRFSKIKQLAITLQSLDDFVHLLPLCPELTCLNLNLQNCHFTKIETPDNLSSIDIPSTLRVFSLRTSYTVNITIDEMKNIFKYLPSKLEQLAIEIFTEDNRCVSGQQWENYLQENFPELNRFEFFIILRKEDPNVSQPIRLPEVLKTFQSAYWPLITPQKITGYYNRLSDSRESICIHTEIIPTVRRRRYFLY